MSDTATPRGPFSLSDIVPFLSTQQPRKLRESCVHCAHSKVKCGKEKPTCSRCVRRLLTCKYTLSRRNGRTPRVVHQVCVRSEDASPIEMSPPTASISPNWGSAILPECYAANRAASSSSMAPSPIPPISQSSSNCVSQAANLWTSFLPPHGLVQDSEIAIRAENENRLVLAIPTQELDFFDMNSIQGDGMEAHVSVNNPPPLPTVDLPDRETAGITGIQTTDPPCCRSLILRILPTVFAYSPTACHNFPAAPAYIHAGVIQTVIQENQEMLETISAILHCSCSEDEFLITVVSLTVFDMMSRYAAAAGRTAISVEYTTDNGDSLMALENTGNASDDDGLPPAGMAGSCRINTDSQRRMTAQLVLNELHRLQQVINVLSSRLESARLKAFLSSAILPSDTRTTRHPDASIGGQASLSPLSGSIFLQLEEDLRKRLHTVYSETLNVLRQS
ncbi:aflatoxin regulatory protein-domain-containing protein [Aspergillus pseudoustus]|uniref:Aflatoxin regulatory protein-domain-containing protein n=1 Tax=Aspergillus pseudoustus TaxID=1810923 RepID=A0ABR4J8T1_9EURO